MTILRFSTCQFDIAKAQRPSINPIYGHSLAEMLRQEFGSLGYEVDEEVDEEDWGWYFYTTIDDQSYMVGTCAYVDTHPETEDPVITKEPVEHLIQFNKRRTFKEILLRRNKFSKDESIVAITEAIVKRKILDMTDFSKES